MSGVVPAGYVARCCIALPCYAGGGAAERGVAVHESGLINNVNAAFLTAPVDVASRVAELSTNHPLIQYRIKWERLG